MAVPNFLQEFSERPYVHALQATDHHGAAKIYFVAVQEVTTGQRRLGSSSELKFDFSFAAIRAGV